MWLACSRFLPCTLTKGERRFSETQARRGSTHRRAPAPIFHEALAEDVLADALDDEAFRSVLRDRSAVRFSNSSRGSGGRDRASRYIRPMRP